jgi:TRAP-type C4-dicarboxylate transport system substrate-binding protein
MIDGYKLACCGLIVAAVAMAGPAPAQEIKLTFADQNSPAGWGPSHALQPWVKQVQDATKGRVKIEVYPSQTLIKGVDMWKGIRSGIADIGWCVQGYWPEQTPLSDVMSLPFLPITSAEKGSETLWRLYEKFPAMQKEFSDIQPLVLYTSSPNLLVSKKPVKTAEEFKGLKFRVLGGPPTEMAKALGAVPTLMSTSRSTRAWSMAPPLPGRRCRVSVSTRWPRATPSRRSTSRISRCARINRSGNRCPRTCATRS